MPHIDTFAVAALLKVWLDLPFLLLVSSVSEWLCLHFLRLTCPATRQFLFGQAICKHVADHVLGTCTGW